MTAGVRFPWLAEPRRSVRLLVEPAVRLIATILGDPLGGRGTLGEYDGGLRALIGVLSNRRGIDLPLACVPASMVSRRRIENALSQLSAWHHWAVLTRQT